MYVYMPLSSIISSENYGDELDVFQAERYFSSDNVGSISFRANEAAAWKKKKKVACERRRRSLDLPVERNVMVSSRVPETTSSNVRKKLPNLKQSSISPRKRLANMISSFLHHSGFRKKNTMDREEHSIREAKVKNNGQKLRSQLREREEALELVTSRRYEEVYRLMEKDEIWGEDGVVIGKWTLNKRCEGLMVDDVMWDGGYSANGRFLRSEELEHGDDDESDSSSDLFELPCYSFMEERDRT